MRTSIDITFLSKDTSLLGNSLTVTYHRYEGTRKKMFTLSSKLIRQSFFTEATSVFKETEATRDFEFFASVHNINCDILRKVIISDHPW